MTLSRMTVCCTQSHCDATSGMKLIYKKQFYPNNFIKKRGKPKMKIGVSSYSYNQYIKAGKLDNISVIKKAVDMGFEAIEYIGLPGETTEERHALALQMRH